MKVLIACEFSGAVRDAFTKLGHDAISCDLEPTSIPGPHFQGDIFEFIRATQGKYDFDLMIAHPPCTYLTVTGNKWFKLEYKNRFPNRPQQRKDAIDFFMKLSELPIPRIAIENPIGIMSTTWRKPDQIIHPWQFGHEASKSTCLWLKGLPKLTPTKIVSKGEFITYKSGKRMTKWYADAASLSPKEREKVRNTTFPGIAQAMAEQWGNLKEDA
jgi:site-specific DNA-cytosine methylase